MYEVALFTSIDANLGGLVMRLGVKQGYMCTWYFQNRCRMTQKKRIKLKLKMAKTG
jgi:hypothetical protein